MGKIAFVFAGQGAQAPGMGEQICQVSKAAADVFQMADAVRPGTSSQCFAGTEEELQQTINTQPCLFAVEMAIAAAMEEAGMKADMTAGFSLGELSALTYAGVMSPEDGLRIVTTRAEQMQACSEKHDTSMAAVMKLTNEQIQQLCESFEHIYPVNFNCPGQTSVSGDSEEMLRFADAVKEAGGRAKILKVSGAFHSPYMTEAAQGFSKAIETYDFQTPVIPVYSNCTGEPYPDDIPAALSAQINHPVKWETIIRNMIVAGADTFVELGPGKTLSGLIKRISADVHIFNVAAPEDLEKIKTEWSSLC